MPATHTAALRAGHRLTRGGTLWSWPGQNPFRWRDPSGRDAEEWFLRNSDAIVDASLAVSGAAFTIATLGAGWEVGAALAGGRLALGGALRFAVIGAAKGAVTGAAVEGGRQLIASKCPPDFGKIGAAAAVGAATGAVFGARGAVPRTSGLGDLTSGEVKQIQSVVDSSGRPLEVVGSAAKGTRRGIGSALPIGKGEGARSDIDYMIPHGSAPYYEGLHSGLPSLDKGGPLFGVHNPFIGPAIRFEPGARPVFVPGAQ